MVKYAAQIAILTAAIIVTAVVCRTEPVTPEVIAEGIAKERRDRERRESDWQYRVTQAQLKRMQEELKDPQRGYDHATAQRIQRLLPQVNEVLNDR